MIRKNIYWEGTDEITQSLAQISGVPWLWWKKKKKLRSCCSRLKHWSIACVAPWYNVWRKILKIQKRNKKLQSPNNTVDVHLPLKTRKVILKFWLVFIPVVSEIFATAIPNSIIKKHIKNLNEQFLNSFNFFKPLFHLKHILLNVSDPT
jgi:hypothetical protein